MSAAPWIKLWWTWYSSRSHLGLSGVALALGPALMLVCRESAERHGDSHCDTSGDGFGDGACDAVRVVDKRGKPVTAAALANIVRFPVDQVEAALKELVDSETLTVSADGVYSFPNFWRYQETAQAARTRKYRERKKRHSDGVCDGCGDALCDGVCDAKRVEGRGKRKEDRETPPVSPPKGGAAAGEPKAKRKSKSAAVEALERALAEQCAPCPPALTNSQAARAGKRVQQLVDGGAAVTLSEAAARLVAAWKASGATSAWKLLDVDPVAPPRAVPANANGRLLRARPGTAADFENEPDLEEQMRGWANV